MADQNELSDAEKMRLKRLARLGGPSTSATSESSSSQTNPEEPPAPSAIHTPASASSRLLSTPLAATKPSPPPTQAPAPKPKSLVTPIPTTAKAVTPSLGKRPSSSTPSNESAGPRVVASRQQQSLLHTDYTEWETLKVSEVFSVTLNVSILDTNLADSPQKQKAEEKDWRLCWLKDLEQELVSEADSQAFNNDEKKSWSATFDKVKALIISYCGMTLEDPTMFPQPSDKPVGPAEFLPLLLSVTPNTDPNADSLTSTAKTGPSHAAALTGPDLLPFLNDLSVGFPSETMADVITPTLSLFFQEWYKIFPTPDLLGPDWRRYLGAVGLFVQVKAIAALPEIWKTYFSNPTERKKEDIDANKSNLRYTLTALHTSLFNIYNAIVRASPESREGVLDFFALTLRLNEKRAGMRIDKVDSGYYKSSTRLNIEDETKIRGTKEEADEYFGNAMEVDAKPNFISDLFFLTNAFVHLGVVKTIATRTRAEKNISEMEKELKRMEATRGSWVGNPAMEAQGEAGIKKLKVSPAAILPLPAEAPLDFRMLPEYLFDNIAEYYDFLSRYEPDAMEDLDKDILITFAITFLSPNYVNNPFLKAKLVSILSYGLWPMGYWRRGALFDRLSVHEMSTKHLMPTLIRFYIEITGGHTQFWDKFNFRRDISRIFKSMWTNPLHREAFVKARQ
ncbi:hypothetical protein CI109_101603 [Kwoniella shandongensis]|uniref:Ubiquitin conjugation factor E4 core domain-containing protein n=1 Tax=Kwoniella shandongensis TaxID=1734106 RepID=A0AAJ8MTP7_9TREE